MVVTFEVAGYLGRGEQWFADHRAELEAAGFPCLDPLIGLYDLRAVDRWLDRRVGMAPASPANDPLPAPANDAEAPIMAAIKSM